MWRACYGADGKAVLPDTINIPRGWDAEKSEISRGRNSYLSASVGKYVCQALTRIVEGIFELAPKTAAGLAAEIIEKAAGTAMTSAEIAAKVVTTITDAAKSPAVIIAETDAKVDSYRKPLLRYTTRFLPNDRSAIPVLVRTTTENSGASEINTKAYSILCDAIKKCISKTGFKHEACKMVSGEEEALYGWVAENYSVGTFSKKTPSQGFIDMSGDSARIAFCPALDDCKQYRGPLTLMTVGNTVFKVFVRAWAGLGVRAIWNRREKNKPESNSIFEQHRYSDPYPGYGNRTIALCDFDGCHAEVLLFIGCTNKNCVEGSRCVDCGNGCLMKDAPIIGGKTFLGLPRV